MILPSLLLAAAALSHALTPSAALAKLSDDYWEQQMRLSPLYATFVGHPRYSDRLDDIGASGRAEQRRVARELLDRLQAIDPKALADDERVTWKVMKLQLDKTLESERYKFWQWNVDHMDGPQSWIPTVIAMGQPMRDSADAEALLLRLKAVPVLFAQQISNLREGEAEGRVAARVPVQKLIAQLEGLLATPPEQSPYLKAVDRLPADLKAAYAPFVLQAVKTHVYPAYRDYLRFLQAEYLPVSRETKIGLGALPGGREAYRFAIRDHTTVDKSPEELHQLGLDELAAIDKELRAIADRMGFKGDLKAFRDKISADPKNFFETREQVLQTARDIVARAQRELPRYFGRLPKTGLDVTPIEDYKEQNDVAARYYQPPSDLSRPGVYFINTYAPSTRSRFGMVSLACHEGVPGHHLQIAEALEQRDMPVFRRNAGFNAFVEGWALYSERLCDEMGLYPDDLSRVGMLSDQAWRAARLVVDTGIHAMGWERRRAIDFMKANMAASEESIVAEVDRYTIWPGQALSYKVGQLELLSLREESKRALGPRFDLRAFHDLVLKNGAVPLDLLRELVAEHDRQALAGAARAKGR